MRKRILVVGGLAAGPSAASKAARTSPDAEVVLFEQGEHISYGICEIPYFIAGEVPADRLVAYTPERLREVKGVDVRIHHRVEEIQPIRRSLRVRDLRTGKISDEPYDRLVIATGSLARRLGIERESARNVFQVKSLHEGHAIKRYLDTEKPARAVIIGGGYIGMEMADVLRRLGLEVTLLHLHPLPMKGLERNVRERVREELEKNGVEFVAHAHTEELAGGKGDKVAHVVTRDGSYEADLVILCIGVQPNATLARAAGIRTGPTQGILTDQRQQTSADNIFAAGDCCEVRNVVSNRSMYIPLATIANRAGRVAGENAAGGSAVFRGAIRAIAVRVFGLEVAHVGLGSDEAREAGFDVVTESITGWSHVAVMPGSSRLSVTVIADRRSRRVLGANVIGAGGAVQRANTLAVAIQHQLTVDEVQQLDLIYSPPFAPLWDPILIAANQTAKKL